MHLMLTFFNLEIYHKVYKEHLQAHSFKLGFFSLTHILKNQCFKNSNY